MADTDAFGECASFCEFMAGQGRGVGGDGEGFLAEDIERDGGEERAIGATAEGDECGGVAAEPGTEKGELSRGHGREFSRMVGDGEGGEN